jgi:hypothetical protein
MYVGSSVSSMVGIVISSPNGGSVKLVVLFLVNNIFNVNNFSFSLKNDMVLLLVSSIWTLYIEDLCDIFGKNKWLFSITEKSEIDISHTILIDLHSIW